MSLDGTDAALGVDWAAVLTEHGRWLRTVVRARLGEDQAVEEVLQDVSLAAVAGRRPPADPAKVAPWLYRLAVRHALLYRRRRGRHAGCSTATLQAAGRWPTTIGMPTPTRSAGCWPTNADSWSARPWTGSPSATARSSC